jgi:hypothetical protein
MIKGTRPIKLDSVVLSAQGVRILSCGIGISETESNARFMAFENAKVEFGNICKASSDCKDHSVKLSPLRTTCEAFSSGIQKKQFYKCYRGLLFEVQNEMSKEEDNSIKPIISDTDNPQVVSANSMDMFKKAELECGEEIFNKTIGANVDAAIKPSCHSISGRTTSYKIALDFYKMGVISGNCSYSVSAPLTLYDNR